MVAYLTCISQCFLLLSCIPATNEPGNPSDITTLPATASTNLGEFLWSTNLTEPALEKVERKMEHIRHDEVELIKDAVFSTVQKKNHPPSIPPQQFELDHHDCGSENYIHQYI